MSATETNSLLEELKNLNKDLKGELKNTKNSTLSTTTTITSSISSTIVPVISSAVKPTLTEENLSDFILEKAQELIITGLDTVKDLQMTVVNTLDTRAMQGYANIIGATTAAIDTLNAINLERSKQKAQKEIKTMEIEAKKAIGPSKNTHNTVNLIANRETILKMLQEGTNIPAKENIIDLKPEEYSVSEENN
jgi:hypothetical protein